MFIFQIQICANTGKTTTFDELRESTICAANNLRKLGFEKGKMIFLLTNNTVDIVPLVFAALCLGCQISSLPTVCSKAEYEYFWSITNPQFIFCDLELQPTLKECRENLKSNADIFTFDGQIDDSIAVDTLFRKTETDPYFE